MAENPAHSTTLRRMVILGDSIAYGMCAVHPENEWPQVVARLIRTFQSETLEVFNRGLPAEVISPDAPGYSASTIPSLIERYHDHCVALLPDLVIIADAINNMRSGMAVQTYMEVLTTIVQDIQAQTGALIVLIGPYLQRYGCGGNNPEVHPTWSQWNETHLLVYTAAVEAVAEQQSALFVDATKVLNGAGWTLHPDCCHLNDLGHVLIGNAVFQRIATHCSALAQKTLREIESHAADASNTGGTDTDAEIKSLWRAGAARFGITVPN